MRIAISLGFLAGQGFPFSCLFRIRQYPSWELETGCFLEICLLTYLQVSKYYRIPVRSIMLITFTACLLGLVNIGSSTAFNAFTSLALIGHYTSYLLPISLLVIRRFGTKEIPWGPWTLGRWGLWINIISIVYSVILIVFAVFPPFQPVTAKNMNYAGVIFGVAILVSAIMWVVYGRKAYRGPVREAIDEGQLKRVQ